MAKSHLKLVTPAILNRTVTPTRLPNADLRTREYLTEAEVERLMNAARKNRWGHRDATMILVAYRHGLRSSEGREVGPKKKACAPPIRRCKDGAVAIFLMLLVDAVRLNCEPFEGKITPVVWRRLSGPNVIIALGGNFSRRSHSSSHSSIFW
jgi:hypothetical protein